MEERVTVMLFPRVMPSVRLLIAFVVEHVYSTPSDVRTVTSFMLAATIVPVILLALSVEFPDRLLLMVEFPEATKEVLVPPEFIEDVVSFVETLGVEVGV